MAKNNSTAVIIDEDFSDNDLIEEYKKLNEKCDILIKKIKDRKESKCQIN